MKYLLLILAVCLAGCGAGNLSVNNTPSIRVSSCEITDDVVITYVQRGIIHVVTPKVTTFVQNGETHIVTEKVVHFENTLISPIGSDVCTETGYLCPKGELK